MPFLRSLSGRLLIVTVLTVMLLEVLIFLPSVARFRLDYLEDRLRMAELASLAILATPEGMLDAELEGELLDRAGASSIVLRRGGARALVLNDAPPGMVDATYDLRDPDPATLVADGLRALVAGPGRIIRVIGSPDADGDEVEITLDEGPLAEAVRGYARRILLLSLVISAGAALLLFLLMRRLLVRPMAQITANMAAFRRDPENAERVMKPASRVLEIADAEQALAAMQTELREALRQRARLAALGEAVAKVSHDLRNMLSTAQLLADRIEGSADPVAARVGPKLVASLDRAVTLCQSTLRFGAAKEAEPIARRIALAALVDEVGESVFPDMDDPGPVRFENLVPPGLLAVADPDQTFRILANLVRNARQALESAGRPGAVRVLAQGGERAVALDIVDDGPGLPAKAIENLFQPFRGGARREGAGLGLAIAHELAVLQGGALALVSSTTQGVVFRLTLPAAMVR
jgi:signal transduction histidine kinase